MPFNQLPVLNNSAGRQRTVGFELEYANLTVEESVQLIQELFGGSIQKESRFRQMVIGTRLGDFTVEFDLTLLTEKKYKKFFETLHIPIAEIKVGGNTLESELETVLEGITGKIFPNEICCPPVNPAQLNELEKLRTTLFEHHAAGTQDFPTNAFGTHINIEAPNLEAATLLNYMRAFILLYPWLLEVGKTDLARKISPFIDPFPDDFAALILQPDYNPTLDSFIADYNKHNPDRNRPLDLYPILVSLKPEIQNDFGNLGKVKPRHTFHYRLPNSSISQPTWTLAEEWNNWIKVEELAKEPPRITTWSKAYLTLQERTLVGFEHKWKEQIKQWLS